MWHAPYEETFNPSPRRDVSKWTHWAGPYTKNTKICITRKRTWTQNHTEKCICVAKTASRQRQSNSPDLWEQRCCGQVNRFVSWQGGWASVAKSNLPIIPINLLIYSNQLYLEGAFIHGSCSAPIEQHSQRAFKSSHRSGRICGLQKLVFMSREVALLCCVCQTRLSRLT